MSRLLDMLKLNTLWLLCSGVAGMFVIELILAITGLSAFRYLSFLPLITMGAATTAVFSVTLRMVDEQEGYIAEPFFRSFRENFKKGNIIGIIFLIAIYGIWIDFQFYNAAETLKKSSMGYLIIGIIAVVIVFTHLIYAFPLQARYENSVINTLRNSFSISIKFFVRTIGLLIVLVLLAALFLWSSTTQFLGILIGPSCIMLAISASAIRAFRIIERENEDREQG